MKKRLQVFLVLLCTMMSVQLFAQRDTIMVQNAVYQELIWDSMPVAFDDSLTATDNALADLRQFSTFKGYKLNVPEVEFVNIAMSADFDSYLYLLDSNFNTITSNDDWDGSGNGSQIMRNLTRGTYYIIATTYDHQATSYARHYNLSVNVIHSVAARNAEYKEIIFDSLPVTIHDSLDPLNPFLADTKTGASFTGYKITIPQVDGLLNIRMIGSFDEYLFLLDNNFEVVTYNDDASSGNGSNILTQVAPGTYYIIATTYSSSSVSSVKYYDLSVEINSYTNLRNLNYRPLALEYTFTDSVTDDSQETYMYDALYKVNGYSFSADKDKFFYLNINNSYAYPCLLDSNYNILTGELTYSMGYSLPYTGKYYLIIAKGSSSIVKYSLTTSIRNGINMRDMNYTNISLGDTIQDAFTNNNETVNVREVYGRNAKGYTFRAQADHWLAAVASSLLSSSVPSITLLDSNFNIISDDILDNKILLPYSGRYYLIATTTSSEYALNTRNFHFVLIEGVLNTYYVDQVNGDDDNNGTSTTTAFKSLAKASSVTNGMGVYYIMSDYTINADDTKFSRLSFDAAKIIPYRDTIRITVDNATYFGYSNAFSASSIMRIGDPEGINHFVFQNINNTSLTLFTNIQRLENCIIRNSHISRLTTYGAPTLKNVEIANVYCPNSLLYNNNNIILTNVNLHNDTIHNIASVDGERASIELTNTNITNNYFERYIFSTEEGTIKIVNSTFTNNVNEASPMITAYAGTIDAVSGTYANNASILSGLPTLGIDSLGIAGIYLLNSTMNYGADFTIDTNNYVFLSYDESYYYPNIEPSIKVDENINGSYAAKVLPIAEDYSGITLDYKDGYTILTGSAIANNYTKFIIAQSDTLNTWYLLSDGKIYKDKNGAGIEQAQTLIAQVYPNPTVNELFIRFENSNISSIRVYDMQGREVIHQQVNQSEEVVNVSNIPSGMYFIQMIEGKSVVGSSKFIKK